MTEEQQEITDLYLRGELSDLERKAFELKMNQDPLLKESVGLQQEIQSRLAHRKRKEQLTEWSIQPPHNEKKNTFSFSKFLGMGIAACLIVSVTMLFQIPKHDNNVFSQQDPSVTFDTGSESPNYSVPVDNGSIGNDSYSQGLATVQAFGDNMQLWAATGNVDYLHRINELYDEQVLRVSDEIAFDIIQKQGLENHTDIFMSTYLNWFECALDGGIKIEFSDYKNVSSDEIERITVSEVGFIEQPDVEFVSCRIRINGTQAYDVYDLLFIREGKIIKITRLLGTDDKVNIVQ